VSNENLSVSLVLGSGGARGHAHIGVIRALEEYGLRIHNIAGCSMGALIGGMYAAGKLDTYTEWAWQLEKSDVVRLLDFSFNWKSLFKGERIFEVLKELVGDRQIEDLDRGYTAVATSLDEQREVWLNEGSLFRAMRASCSVPGVFSPVEYNGKLLVDGGLVNPIPIAPTLNDSTDLTIAVNLNAMASAHERRLQERRKRERKTDPEHRNKIKKFLDQWFSREPAEDDGLAAAEVLTRSIDVMQGAIARLKLAAYAPDEVIEIPREAASFFEFHRAEEMAELGYDKTHEVLAQLDC
jgi:NTE family protein